MQHHLLEECPELRAFRKRAVTIQLQEILQTVNKRVLDVMERAHTHQGIQNKLTLHHQLPHNRSQQTWNQQMPFITHDGTITEDFLEVTQLLDQSAQSRLVIHAEKYHKIC